MHPANGLWGGGAGSSRGHCQAVQRTSLTVVGDYRTVLVAAPLKSPHPDTWRACRIPIIGRLTCEAIVGNSYPACRSSVHAPTHRHWLKVTGYSTNALTTMLPPEALENNSGKMLPPETLEKHFDIRAWSTDKSQTSASNIEN